LGLALIIASSAWVRARLALQAARRQLREVTAANETLRKALGDMTVVIVSKDRVIDRLAHSPCEAGKNAQPKSPIGPDRRKVFKSNTASKSKIARASLKDSDYE
jgi:hypothetical protein